MVEAIGLHALEVEPRASSRFKVRGHDRLTLGHDAGVKGRGPLMNQINSWGST